MIIVWWIVLSFLIIFWAEKWGRDGGRWFALSIIISPLIAGIALAIAGKNSEELEGRELKNGTSKKCPACAELIKAEAIKCKHCGADVSGVTNQIAQERTIKYDVLKHKRPADPEQEIINQSSNQKFLAFIFILLACAVIAITNKEIFTL